MKIYENEFVEVYYQYRNSDLIVISFNEMGLRPGLGAWGQSVFEKSGTSYLGFVSKTPNWFPTEGMHDALACSDKILAENGFGRTVTFGHSQGGYAALKFARRLQADTVLAFCPQYSIRPEDMEGKDGRFRPYYRPDLTQPPVNGSDAGTDCFITVFYDPSDKSDAMNVAHIKKSLPHIQTAKIFGTGHQTIRAFSGTENFTRLLSASLDKDFPRLLSLSRSIKRSWNSRRVYLARSLLRSHHHRIGQRLLETCLNQINAEIGMEIFQSLARNRADGFIWEHLNSLTLPLPAPQQMYCKSLLLKNLIAAGHNLKAAEWFMLWLADKQLHDTALIGGGYFNEFEPAISRLIDSLNNSPQHLYLMGWFNQENWGRWSKSTDACLVLNNTDGRAHTFRCGIRKIAPEQEITVHRLDGNRWIAHPHTPSDRMEITVEAQSSTVLRISANRLFSPAELHIGNDERLLGIGIETPVMF
ncbi:hypothetical protein [Neisseria sp.]|uniref:hypothetical protein n=1 Tax=Neisseria sp. TaxID=192066 RepID=UPI0035A03FAC